MADGLAPARHARMAERARERRETAPDYPDSSGQVAEHSAVTEALAEPQLEAIMSTDQSPEEAVAVAVETVLQPPVADEDEPPTSPVVPDGARPFGDLQTTGLLWLVNRVVFHPRGFALALMRCGGRIVGWKLLGDGGEVWRFDGDEDQHFADVAETFRVAALGDAGTGQLPSLGEGGSNLGGAAVFVGGPQDGLGTALPVGTHACLASSQPIGEKP